jgi:hypothetical protein
MALATYADLQSQIANWLARDDLTTYIPDFITLFECAAARKLKVRLQESTTTLTPTSGVATLPTDYLGYRRVTWTGTPIHELAYVAPPIYASYLNITAGIPTQFTIEGTNLRVIASDDTALTFDYFQKTPALSGTLNWLYTNHPDAYLFGSLCEANAFNKGQAFDAASLWKTRRDEVFNEIAMLDFNERQGMAIRVLGVLRPNGGAYPLG